MLELKQISKAYGAVQALDNVSLTAERGEVHAIVGENGAGKSTLMRVLGGVVRPDAGEVRMDGEAVTVFDPLEARRRGVAMVHQELSLAPNLSVAENIFAAPAGRPTWMGLLRWSEMRRRTAELLARFGERAAAAVHPAAIVGDLPMGLRQVVEIAKALAADPRVLILDEPTSSLEEGEAAHLLDSLRQLKERGLTIFYISHRMPEVFALAGRISVLRDGKLVGSGPVSETSLDRVIAQMVGRDITQGERPAASAEQPPLLEVRGLTRRGQFENIGFSVRPGEILGLAGLVGAGRTESMQALVGFRPLDAGSVVVAGRAVQIRRPADALAAGVIYLPEDRKREGLFLEHTVAANIIAASLAAYTVSGMLSKGRAASAAFRLAAQVDVRARGMDAPASSLSGGNQQKVLVAKALATSPKVLIVDEPTRGIDIAGKSEIHAILRRFAAAGGAVILISSELPELLSLSTRLLVYAEGRIVAGLDAASAGEEIVMRYATGHG